MKRIRPGACGLFVLATLLLAQAVVQAHHEGPSHAEHNCDICLFSHYSPLHLPAACEILPVIQRSERVDCTDQSRPDEILHLRASQRAPPRIAYPPTA